MELIFYGIRLFHRKILPTTSPTPLDFPIVTSPITLAISKNLLSGKMDFPFLN